MNDRTNVGDIIGSHAVAIGDNPTVNYTKNYYQQITPRPVAPEQLRAALALLDQLPLETIPPVTDLPIGSHLPHARNAHFVGREDELRKLAHYFDPKRSSDEDSATGVAAKVLAASVSQAATATGMGGIGKSQLAIAFAHRYGQYFQGGVYWISMANPGAVPAEVVNSAGQMDGLGVDFPTLSFPDQLRRVLAQWQSALPRLLIFDNCEDPKLLDQWRPTTGGCRVLMTSRRQQWAKARSIYALPLDSLPRSQSIALLLKFRPDLADNFSPESAIYGSLDAIAHELGDLPLALHLAGSYLDTYRHDISLDGYLTELRDVKILGHSSLQSDPHDYSPTEHDLHVGRTFALSTQRLDATDSTDALAQKLLARAAYFAPGEPIPRPLLFSTLDDTTEGGEIPEITHKSDALRRLTGLGLLEENEQGALTIHRLVMHFVQGLALDELAQTAVEHAIHNQAGEINNSGIPGPLLTWQPHLRHITDQAKLRRDERAALFCNQLGYHLSTISAYHEALPYYKEALSIRLEVLGEKHPDTATSLNNLGGLLDLMGAYEDAHPYYEEALSILKEVLGENHPHTATSLNNLGKLLNSMGAYEDARPYYEKALAIQLEVLGEKHPSTATSLNNLGLLLYSIGAYEDARLYLEEALSIRLEVLGEKHPDTATSLNSLGMLLGSIGAYEDARLYSEEALSIQLEVLGEKHANTASSLNNLGVLLYSIGAYEDARPYYEKALSIRLEVLGEKHPDTAISLNSLGALLYSIGAYEDARLYLEKALAIQLEVLGEKHPDMVKCLKNLGFLHRDIGAYEDAYPYLEEALSIQLEVPGKKYPDTASSLNDLGTLHSSMGAYEDARPYFKEALSIRLEVLGKKHPDTASSLNNLGTLFLMGAYEDARPYFEEALAISEAALGVDHPQTRTIRNNLAELAD